MSSVAAGRPLEGSEKGVRAASRGARGGTHSYQTDAVAPGGHRAEPRAGGTHRRAFAGKAAQARAPPWRRQPILGRSTRGAGEQEAGGAVGALPLPRLPVRALCLRRVVGFGLSGSRSLGEAAGYPEAVGVWLGHARCRGLSPSILASMKDSGDSKDQQLMVRPHQPPRFHPQPRLPVGLLAARPSSPPLPQKDIQDQGMGLSSATFPTSWMSRRTASWPSY